MPQVSGQALAGQLRRVIDAQAAVTDAARQAAEQVRQERGGPPPELSGGQPPEQGTQVPGPTGTIGPTQP